MQKPFRRWGSANAGVLDEGAGICRADSSESDDFGSLSVSTLTATSGVCGFLPPKGMSDNKRSERDDPATEP